MTIVAGSLIVKDNKILMIQEAKKSCYGQWNFPAGHKVKTMTKDELRGFDTALNDIKNLENGKIYPLELFDTKIYRR